MDLHLGFHFPVGCIGGFGTAQSYISRIRYECVGQVGDKIEFFRKKEILFPAVFQVLPLRDDRCVEDDDGFHVLRADAGEKGTGGFDQGFFIIVFQRFKVCPVQCNRKAADGTLTELVKQRAVSPVQCKTLWHGKSPQEPGRKVV